MKRLILRSVLFGPGLVLLVASLAWLSLPWPVLLRWRNPETTSLMGYRVQEAEAAGEELDMRRRWVPLEEISPHVVRAVILAEDARFREHGGVDWPALAEEVHYEGGLPFRVTEWRDWKALGRAVRYFWENRSEVRGRSTITQQLAKNLYYTPERSLARKVGEFVVARRLEWFLSKERILELYLNVVELGPGLFGVEAAAREYFGVPASVLSPYQAASLAATLPHPLTSNPAHRPGRMAWRRDLILQRMRGGTPEDVPIPEAPPPIELEGVAPALEEPRDTTGGGTELAPVELPDTSGDRREEDR